MIESYQVEPWKHSRLKPNGSWADDVLFCVFYAMEDCEPFDDAWNWKHNPELKRTYILLVEVACEYVRDTADLAALDKLFTHLLSGVPSSGLTGLVPSARRDFFETMAWMLNTNSLARAVGDFLDRYGYRTPEKDGEFVHRWDEAYHRWENASMLNHSVRVESVGSN